MNLDENHTYLGYQSLYSLIGVYILDLNMFYLILY